MGTAGPGVPGHLPLIIECVSSNPDRYFRRDPIIIGCPCVALSGSFNAFPGADYWRSTATA